jgi:hypothetical protein
MDEKFVFYEDKKKLGLWFSAISGIVGILFLFANIFSQKDDIPIVAIFFMVSIFWYFFYGKKFEKEIIHFYESSIEIIREDNKGIYFNEEIPFGNLSSVKREKTVDQNGYVVYDEVHFNKIEGERVSILAWHFKKPFYVCLKETALRNQFALEGFDKKDIEYDDFEIRENVYGQNKCLQDER